MQRVLVVTALIALACAACATVEKAPADPRLEEAQKAFDEGKRLKEAGKYSEAIPFIERAQELREAVLTGTHPKVADCLDLLGVVHMLNADYPRAELLLGLALKTRRAALGENHPDVSSSLHNLAFLAYSQGLYARAELLYEDALKRAEASLGNAHPTVANVLHNMGLLYYAQGHYERAESLYKRALEVAKAAFGEAHSDVAMTLHNLAALYEAQGHHERARPLYERALKAAEAALGENHPDVASLLNSVSVFYLTQGLYAHAEPLLQRALAIQRAALGNNHPEVAISLHNLAALYGAQKLYSHAEPLYEEAIRIEKTVYGPNHPSLGNSLNNLASLYADQELYDRASPLQERALKIGEAAFGEKHPDVVSALNNLASLYQAQGLYTRAEPLYERALKIRLEIFGENHPTVALSLHNLAGLYDEQGLHARAEPLYERAIKVGEAALDANHPDVVKSIHNLARLYTAQGQFTRAEPLYVRALGSWEAALGENHPYVTTALHNFASLRLGQKQLDAALPLFQRALSSSEQHLRKEVFGYSEKRLANFLRQLRSKEEELYTLVRTHPGDKRVVRLALSAALLRKGRSIQEVANTSHIIYRDLDSTGRETFDRLRVLRTQLATLSLAGPGKLSSADYMERLKALTDEGDTLEAALTRQSEPLRRLHHLPQPAQLISHVTAALPNNGALVEFVAYTDRSLIPRTGSLLSQADGQLRYLALLLFADGRTIAVDLGHAAPIDRAASRLHDALARQAASYLGAARSLYQLVFRPLVPYLGKEQRLFLAPDGQLNLIPFAALHDGRRFLVDAFDITYLTSGKDLLPRSSDRPSSRSMVVLADPDFDSLPSTPPYEAQATLSLAERSASLKRFFSALRSEGPDIPWTRLPGTREEAEAIQRLYPEAQLFLGAAATKQVLLKLPTPGLLHIATHGFFFEDAPRPPATRAVGYIGAVAASPETRPADPLLRSGLVLAGAHPSAEPSSSRRPEYSLVTALELAGLNLWGTQLVVLSACDTGRGDVKLGEGVYGLRRAFLVAGAETVVTSLWKVNDDATRQLMESYYGHLLASRSRISALREAMKDLRRQRPHPHFWAAFTALGLDAPLQGLTPHTAARSAH